MKEMKSEIKEIRTISGEVVEHSWLLDDHIPIEIFYRDGSREINCTPFPLKEPYRFVSNRAAVAHAAWREQNEKKQKVISAFETTYTEHFPRQYYERKIAIIMKERDQENKRFTLNTRSLEEHSAIIRFAMPSMCSASFRAEKKWLRKISQWNQRVKINAEIYKDGKIEKSI